MNEFIDENESWNTSSETDTTDTFMSIESLRCTDEKGISILFQTFALLA